MASADWLLFYIGVNVSMLLGTGLKTNKQETWERPEGESRPSAGTSHKHGCMLRTLISWLKSTKRDISPKDVWVCRWQTIKKKTTENKRTTTPKITALIMWFYRRRWAQPYNKIKILEESRHPACVSSSYSWAWNEILSRCFWLFRK